MCSVSAGCTQQLKVRCDRSNTPCIAPTTHFHLKLKQLIYRVGFVMFVCGGEGQYKIATMTPFEKWPPNPSPKFFCLVNGELFPHKS